MIEVTIPGHRHLRLDYLVLDHNGTLAVDGILLPGVRQCLETISEKLEIFVITADTFGQARVQLERVPCELTILPAGDQDRGKLAFVERLGVDRTVCIGNGRNDALMLKASALGIAVILDEGAAMVTVNSADVVCVGILPALELLLDPLRLTATLRS
jgi:soluble P-type ATPase